MSGQNDLQSRDHDHHGDKDDPKESGAKKNIVNKFKLSVLSNAVCVDILVWATKDENGKIDSFTQCGNFRIFLPFRFYVKSIFEIVEVIKVLFFAIL